MPSSCAFHFAFKDNKIPAVVSKPAPPFANPLFNVLLLAAIAISMSSAHGADSGANDDAIEPYRPTVSNPAQLPIPGRVELEFGGLHSKTADQHRDSLPYLFKLALTPQWGLLLGGEAFVDYKDPAVTGTPTHMRGVGDTMLTLKRAFLMDDATALGLEFGAKIPTARDFIGSGHPDYDINGIFSRDLGKIHMDVNLNLTRIGGIDPGTALTQTGLSTAFSAPLTEHVGVTGELSGLRRDGTASTAQTLLALTYNPNKQLTIDMGLIRGLNPASPTMAIFSGVVVPVGRLF